MTIHLKLMTLTGRFETQLEIELATMAEVRETVRQHIAQSGYTNLKEIDDADSIRFTARTPGGRGGRNVAYADLYY